MTKHIREERIARLSAASEQKKQDALNATQKAIRKLQQQGKVISFNAVAREAEVSTSYLYKYPELKNKIAKLREEQKRSGRKIPVASDNSKNRIIGHLKKRIKELEQQITQLRQANQSLAGRVFELEEYENTVKRFREHNQKLSTQIEKLSEENSQLKNKLATLNLGAIKKVTSSHTKQKRPHIPVPNSVKMELANLGISINSTLRKLIRQNPEEITLEAIEALKYALSTQVIKNPAGWLAEGIKNRWKKSETHTQETQNEELVFPKGFEEWYIQAIDALFILNESPTELPKNMKGELLVKVNRPTSSGLPYSLMSWLQAKKMMEMESQSQT
ncbi:DUF6262 family protein [Rivularia sp. UHCC 0363]|uniref:DUF6262 family protein n=1 Tax=Rivularia sp. UHCC 0363 TaxID=3110244 RepID=UPI002B1F9EB1|nr:DUF6262 family protein [Rivularia sp. UHCC 0363]MEA5596829.1 DUF6262 family protein [Rivularia sp. UHCC 0363]